MDGESTELAASANVGEETAAVVRDAGTEETAPAPKTPEAETTVLADEVRTELADALAWSDSEAGSTEPAQYVERRSGWRWAIVAVAVMLPLAAVLALGMVFFHTRHAPTRARVPAPPNAALDGTYRVDVDLAKGTVNGAPNAQPNTDNTAWWAFRSSCGPIGCVATGVKLDVNNHQLVRTPADTAEFHFVDGHWQRTPVQTHVQHPQSRGADGKCVVAGVDTGMVTWSLKPQLDGTLRGVNTVTTLTNQCDLPGEVYQAPLVATRMGDVPPSVTVAEPAAVTPPTTSITASAVGGPVLDGTYSVHFEYTKQTKNGAPTDHKSAVDTSHWWAFRSLCTSVGCVAAGVQLADENHQEAIGVADVLRFADGQWQDTPNLRTGRQCAGATNGSVTETDTINWSLEPQPDGTLHGVWTITVLTNECGEQDGVWRIPLVVSREGDVPPSVVIADPALLIAPPPPTTTPPRTGG
jgi:hypothetical protein